MRPAAPEAWAMRDADVVVVGAGVLGLAHATLAAERGLKVILVDRSPVAVGASVRNFGMIWPIGLPPGALREAALLSRRHWMRLAKDAGFWLEPCGSLHLAYEQDEAALLGEFAAKVRPLDWPVRLLDAGEVLQRTSAVQPAGLLGGLWSDTELAVDPREVIRRLPGWLAETKGVTLRFGDPVLDVADGRVRLAKGGALHAPKVIVCPGDDLLTLFPEAIATQDLVRCKLHMLRTPPQPQGFRIGQHLAGGLTLRHYKAFEGCPSLERLKARIARETPEYDRFGIHVMAAQNGRGEVVLGDSHEYGDPLEPDYRSEIEGLMLRALSRWLRIPDGRIQDRWYGIYAKPREGWPRRAPQPSPDIHVVTGVGGLGMTLSFGLAEETLGLL